jgi:hypothetical protein
VTPARSTKNVTTRRPKNVGQLLHDLLQTQPLTMQQRTCLPLLHRPSQALGKEEWNHAQSSSQEKPPLHTPERGGGAHIGVYALLVVMGERDAAGQGTVRYVKSNGAASGACGAWAAACTLDYALSQAVAGDELWLAAGVYTPTVGAGPTSSFTLTSGVALYGGFAGTETLRAQRNYTANQVILTGDVGVPGDDQRQRLSRRHGGECRRQHGRRWCDDPPRQCELARTFGHVEWRRACTSYSGDLTVANVIFVSNAAASVRRRSVHALRRADPGSISNSMATRQRQGGWRVQSQHGHHD